MSRYWRAIVFHALVESLVVATTSGFVSNQPAMRSARIQQFDILPAAINTFV
jgi:hypothetical protein